MISWKFHKNSNTVYPNEFASHLIKNPNKIWGFSCVYDIV